MENTVNKNEFMQQLSQHAKKIANLAEVNKDILIFGLPEEETKDIVERENKEKEAVMKVLREIEPTRENNDIIAHRRVGRYEKEN